LFIVGQALLSVGIISPAGNPVKELTSKKVKAGSYTVTYLAEEKGDHLLFVNWGLEEVPGSPFIISVA